VASIVSVVCGDVADGLRYFNQPALDINRFNSSLEVLLLNKLLTD
jgi:hypothetical protein